MSVSEKLKLLDNVIYQGGINATELMPGTGACALEDSIILTKKAVSLGCAGVLMLPPFYYKAVNEEGLYRYFASVIEEVADDRLRIYLYHIPPIAHVGVSMNLIERLLKAYPKIVAGIKDSGNDWKHTEVKEMGC